MRIRPRMTLETAASKPAIGRFFTTPFYSSPPCEAATGVASGLLGRLRFVLWQRVGVVLLDLVPQVLHRVAVVRLRDGGVAALGHHHGARVEQEQCLDELPVDAERADRHAVRAPDLPEQGRVLDVE